jgi:transglutaminase-like putative cysteine protease
MNAQITTVNLGGNQLPVLANPVQVQSNRQGQWSSTTATATLYRSMPRNFTYHEVVRQAAPTPQMLRQAGQLGPTGDPQIDQRLFDLPPQPREVVDLATRLTAGKTTAYDKAAAISDYFTNGKNGFTYSLDAPPSDGRAAIVTFLDKKTGFCQQYSAAAAILMRQAGLPARVVLGYTHRPPLANGSFIVTTSDAHAWVEVYFPGAGWVPFDPTPLVGADAGRAFDLPWAPHPDQNSLNPTESAAHPSVNSSTAITSTRALAAHAGSGASVAAKFARDTLIVLAVVALIALVVFGPRWLRTRLRRSRLDRARRTGDPEPLWQELAASAADRDVIWPTTLTEGQVPGWLRIRGIDERGRSAVTAVAERVQHSRYSGRTASEIPPETIDGLDEMLRRWGRRADRRQRFINTWLPRSLISRRDQLLR